MELSLLEQRDCVFFIYLFPSLNPGSGTLWETQRCATQLPIQGKTCCPAAGSVVSLQLSAASRLASAIDLRSCFFGSLNPVQARREEVVLKGKGLTALVGSSDSTAPCQVSWGFVSPALQFDLTLGPVLFLPPSFHRCWSLHKPLGLQIPSQHLLPKNITCNRPIIYSINI